MAAKCPWKTVWITGASTGIGRELALRLARDGAVVAVSARSADLLAELAKSHANIRAYPLDVGDVAAVNGTANRIERELGPIDLAVLNAGIWRMMTVTDFSVERSKESMNVNYFGVVNALEPVMRAMVARGQGHIAFVSSVAGYRGLMKGAAYSPTKAALIALAEALYPHITRKGVKLTIICPGFVETPMTSVNTFPMPFIISVEDAAARIHNGLLRGKYEIVFPLRMMLLMKTLRMMPNWLFFRLVRFGGTRANTLDDDSNTPNT